jgi:hypothetical protein
LPSEATKEKRNVPCRVLCRRWQTGEAFKKRLAGIARNVSHNYVPNVEPASNGKMYTVAADTQEMFIRK